MSDFRARYNALNPAQKRAVDTTEGPVMVVAGPGTGKTELLSLRVANILKTSDALPQNILCLTYTESGAYAMRERLAGLIGADAYKVAIHTFHSFGAEVINRHGEYFYHGAHFRPADELSSYEVLRTIFERLPHDDLLASTMNGEFTYLRDAQQAISDLKKSGLTSDELVAILDRNEQFTDWLRPRLENVFSERLSKKIFGKIEGLIADAKTYTERDYELITYEPLHELFTSSLERALEYAETENSTKPLSAWKRQWCEKGSDGNVTLKDVKHTKRLRSVSHVYYEYLVEMQRRSLFDFDDMILRTVHAMEVFDELRLNLQEQYQYLLVDEFQDTNDAQMRLLWNLSNNPSSEGRPNVMVVGDDDQAIYRFQGANLSNILDFRTLYRDVAIITLGDNYRSAAPILELARDTIVQAEERLERALPEVNKSLTPHFNPHDPKVEFASHPDQATEYTFIATRIAALRKENPDARIAIIARHHRQLQTMLPYLHNEHIPLSYDRRDNALDTPPVLLLEKLARVIDHIAEQRISEANALLPELLAHPAWGIDAHDLWKLSVESYKTRQLWLETMLSYENRLSDIAEWLILMAHLSLHEPFEYLVDQLIGSSETQLPDESTGEADDEHKDPLRGFQSPFREYFFSPNKLSSQPATYLAFLDALSSIRRKIREYRPEGRLQLKEFVHFIDQYRQLGLTIQATGHITADHQPVELLTAHRSKGLEFDTVFVVGLGDAVWGDTARSRGRLISYPHNLPIGISGDTSDEHIRLLFVALTRAKTNLLLTAHRTSESGKQLLPIGYLNHIEVTSHENSQPALTSTEIAWHGHLTTVDHSMQELLRDTLASYRLSATHLCNFLDIARGGPELFLLQNLLRFPQAMSPSAAFGSAIHTTLQRAHSHLVATGKKRPVEDLLGDFEAALGEYQLSSDHYEHYAKKGADILSQFLAKRYDSFSPTQVVEQRFAADIEVENGMRLSGAIDLMDIDPETKTITVTDYKTGKSASSWQGRTDYEKIKLHHYRQQLLFYKLLIEHSREYAGYTVTRGIIEFVEADSHGDINRIEIEYDEAELVQFKQLVRAVWSRIQALEFTLDETYDQNISGIKDFERTLLT